MGLGFRVLRVKPFSKGHIWRFILFKKVIQSVSRVWVFRVDGLFYFLIWGGVRGLECSAAGVYCIVFWHGGLELRGLGFRV